MKEKVLRPTAKISLKKNVLKVYNIDNQDVVYLPKNAEFEIELFNPMQSRVLAKISLNNKVLSGGGIVLKPGERIFLERYLDDDKKFLFETYEVDSSIENIEYIIANNGLVSVSFYEEQNNTFWTNTTYFNLAPRYYVAQPQMLYSSNIGCFAARDAATYTCTTANPCAEVVCSTIETGIIGKGEKSNQDFTEVNYNFNPYTLNTIKVRILPDSQKLVSSEDLKHKRYCYVCGSKIKETNKFCSNCGTKL